MNILHVIFSFTPDGAETMLVDIINIQAETDHVELIIINNLYSKDLASTINKNVTVHYINRRPRSLNPIKIILLNYKVLKSKPDVIHFHNHNAIRLLLLKNKFKTCLTIHSVNKPTTHFSKYNKLFSISKAVEDDIIKRAGIPSKLIYNGINFYKIKVKANHTPNAKFKIVVVSRLLHKVKGQDVLLKALDHLLTHFGLTDISVDFIGEGPSLEFLQQLVNRLKIQNFVNFMGVRSREFIYNNLQNYDLLIQPSIYEGFGLTVVEGMAAKIPVLVSNSEGPSEIICNGKYGHLFENGNPISCAVAIKDLMEIRENAESIKNLNMAFDYAINNFSIQTTAKQYLTEYNSLLQIA